MKKLILPWPSSPGKFIKIFKRLKFVDSKRLFLETPLKQKSWSLFLVKALCMEYYAPRGFPRYIFKRYLVFAKEAEHLDPKNAKFKESSLHTWPWLFSWVRSPRLSAFCPKNFKNFLNWENCKVLIVHIDKESLVCDQSWSTSQGTISRNILVLQIKFA